MYDEFMIGYLEGELIKKYDRRCILKCGQLGYRIFMASGALSKLQENVDTVKVFTHPHVREDAQELYGFLNPEELELFEMLITVSGVGPKSALAIMDEVPFEMLVASITRGEEGVLRKVSGVGQKTAQKIIIDLKTKALALATLATEAASQTVSEDVDILEALQSLGYSAYQAREAIKKIPAETKGVSQRIQEALKVLAK
ncbi:MAG: Holliday junction branch migration protein RuvA [Candidatus Sungbacteria bacterium]|uniref:Holliday junction branch migration complex subunit RuvA n=1 Tax=Candidatus Sungiibacteriota bacterium TaxID=2750080 RepID=A0A931YDK3_9BACT|nr:Holliday junction branch migration protein RuvA [Candidatus Sungbacteria bacterium]